MTRITENKYIKLKGTILRESEKALQFNITEIDGDPCDFEDNHWFPLSQMKGLLRTNTAGQDEIQVTEWIMKQKELI